jgi:hypothetical protein
MPREPPSGELFPGAEFEGRPSHWRDLERRLNRQRKAVQGANARLLCAGWRLSRDERGWVVRHAGRGLELRGLRLRELVDRALAQRDAPPAEQMELFPGR